MRIAVLANLKKNAPVYEGMPADRWDDLDNVSTVDALVQALESLGHEAQFFEASLAAPFLLHERLPAWRPALCFNLAESHFGNAREAHIPCLLEMWRLPYTGSRPLTQALGLDKALTKRILLSHGLPTAPFQLFRHADEPLEPALADEGGALRFPLFVKPNAEGTSIGVDEHSVVESVSALRARVRQLLERYRQPILVERFIPGREVMVGVVGNVASPEGVVYPLELLPILEVDFARYRRKTQIYTNTMKTDVSEEPFHFQCPASLPELLVEELRRLTRATFEALECQDVARIDFRLDTTDGLRPYILELNTLPGLSPGYSDLCLEALALGWDYPKLIGKIVEAALLRHGLSGV